MYICIYFSILFSIVFITKKIYNSMLKPNTIFTFIWCVSTSISSLGLFDIYKPSIIVHFYSISFIMFFNFFFFVFNKGYINNYSIDQYINGKIRFKAIYIFNILSWLYMLKFINKSINIIISGGFSALRIYAYNSSLGLGSTRELILAQNVVQPIFSATILITCFYYNINKKNKQLLIISLIDIIIYLLSFGGRAILVDSIIFYIIIYFVIKNNKKDKIKNKKRKINYAFIIIGFLFFSLITQSRSWTNTSTFKEIFYYFIGPFTFLQTVLDEQMGVYSGLLYGKDTFGFIYNLFYKFLTFIFKIPYNGSDIYITSITALSRFISPTRKFNALTTSIYPFLKDFGFLGIILGTAFLAWSVSFAEKKFKKDNNLYFLCIYVILLYILFNTTLNYYLYSSSYGMLIFILLLFIDIKKRYVKIE